MELSLNHKHKTQYEYYLRMETLSEIDESVWQYLREEFYKWSQDHYAEFDSTENDI